MKNQKGITLIALIITIIVMMILVAVSVTVALQSGLFSAAGNVASDMQESKENEILTSEGQVTVGETTYNSMQEYVNILKGGTGSGTTGKISITINDMPFSVTAGKTWEEVLPEINQQFKQGRVFQ